MRATDRVGWCVGRNIAVLVAILLSGAIGLAQAAPPEIIVTTTIQEVMYKGAKHLKPDELEMLTGLRKGKPFNPIANRLAVNAIRRRYEEMGRLFANVELLEGDKAGDTRVVFNITEGPVVHVSRIHFVGNGFVSGARLNTQIDSSRQFLGLIGDKFDPLMADHAVAKLEDYYKRHGFQDVQVSREFRWEEDHCHVRLVFHIQEGPRYRVATTPGRNKNVSGADRATGREGG